jgi:hypothetical protein
MNDRKVDFAVKFKKDDKEKETEKKEAKPAAKLEAKPTTKPEAKPAAKPEAKPTAKPEAKKTEIDKFDLITIVSSVEMDIPEREPPYNDILYDFIPESEQRVTANRDDHVSKKV